MAPTHQMLTAEMPSDNLLDQRIMHAVKAAKHTANSSPSDSMSNGKSLFLCVAATSKCHSPSILACSNVVLLVFSAAGQQIKYHHPAHKVLNKEILVYNPHLLGSFLGLFAMTVQQALHRSHPLSQRTTCMCQRCTKRWPNGCPQSFLIWR